MRYLFIYLLILGYVSNEVYSFNIHNNIFIKSSILNKNNVITYARDKSVSDLISDNYAQISSLSNLAPEFSNVTILRYILAYPNQPENIENQ